MSFTAGDRVSPPVFIPDEKAHRRALGLWARDAHQGHLANTGTITLSTGGLTTPVIDPRVGPKSVILFMPTTSQAAAVVTNMWVSSRSLEGFTISHISSGAATRIFDYCLLG